MLVMELMYIYPISFLTVKFLVLTKDTNDE